MQEVPSSPFLDAWHDTMMVLSIVMFAAGIVVYLVYKMRVSLIKDYKEKHDFINANEIKWFKVVFYIFGLGVAMLINLYGAGKVPDMGIWFFVRIFMSLAGATLIGYVGSLVLEYYYPTKLNRKLKRWRYIPRINPKTGNKMRLLSEAEEDVHLNQGMQAEENIFSIDYDVWIDEKSGEIKIEKYDGHLIALRCGNCGFFTMKVRKEEIIERYPDETPKEILKHYQCTYCKNVRATQFHVSRKEMGDYKLEKPHFVRNTRDIDLVKIEIHSSLKGKQNFEFQSVEQAQKFLDEFDFDKVA
ncbi:MAG TPA: hypothetical protein PKJ63_11915 [Cyclobacteriaceae bacterium]|nr:hypothetical protein [Cyclobacteriaceae bacterium]HRW99576.1 hypothetical protein [Cyclobacteriaceae bacterium]